MYAGMKYTGGMTWIVVQVIPPVLFLGSVVTVVNAQIVLLTVEYDTETATSEDFDSITAQIQVVF